MDRRAVLLGAQAAFWLPGLAHAAPAGPRLPRWADLPPQLLGAADEADWLESNVPLFDCPDPAFREIWYFRWRAYRRALKRTADGWIVWEFPYDVGWAGLHNALVDAAGHHLYEGRWLRDRRYLDDYTRFWLDNPKAPLRGFSCWMADAVWARHCAAPDDAFLRAALQPLVHNYHQWEDCFRQPSGLYTQVAVNDGMEEAASGPQGLRPTLNSYQYGDARAIAAMARQCGLPSLAAAYDARAEALKSLVQARLWNPGTRFFDTVRSDTGRLSGVRELLGYIPWYFGLPDARFAEAWAQIRDPAGFQAPFGPTTLERRAPGFQLTESDSLWNGSSWPYATSQTLVALANLLRAGDPAPVGKADYMDLLSTYTRSHYRTVDGQTVPWIGESLQPLNGHWTSETRGYNHSTYGDLIVTGLIGLRPRPDETVEVDPLLPDGHWDHFVLADIPYHGRRLTILWDRDGRHYGAGAGLRLWADGALLAHRATLGRLTARLPGDAPPPPAPAVLVRDEIGPGPHVERVTATASYWKARPPGVVIDGYDDDGFWSSHSSGLAADWLQITLPAPQRLITVEWDGYEDEHSHKAPVSAAILWWDGARWADVPTPAATPATPTTGRNSIAFAAVTTDRFRLRLACRKPGRHGIGVGVTEVRWRTEG